MNQPKKPKIFYGYWILVAAFFCLFIYSGTAFYCFSLFVRPLEADFNWGRGEIMAGLTILLMVAGVASPFVGRMVDRYGIRGVITIGAIVAGLGFALLSLMNSLWSFYVCCTIIGIGAAAISTVPASTAVSNWFHKRRGMAIGIVSTGIGMGGFALAPLIGGYLIPNFGWRVTYLAMGLLIWLLIIPLALFVMRTKPADMGLYPDGVETTETVADTEAKPSTIEGVTLKVALATPALWLIGISYLAGAFGRSGVTNNQVPLLEDIGFPVATAATSLGTVAFASAFGRLGFGWLCDRISAKYTWCIGLGFHLVSIATLMSVEPTSPLAMIWLYAITMGISFAGWMPTMSTLVGTTFGLTSYGTIFGMINFIQCIGFATGPLLAGYMHDIMNTYHWFFIISLALCTLAIPTIMAVRRPTLPHGG